MSTQHIIKTVTFKIYLNAVQESSLTEWLRQACWTCNQALEHRIKAYKRRGESVGLYAQYILLTGWRKRMKLLSAAPMEFLRDSLRRVDRGFAAFFRRLREGDKKPGFPRFRSHRRYNSLECLVPSCYAANGRVRIPKIGKVRALGQFDVSGEQCLLRIIRRPSGWYAQVVIDTGVSIPPKVEPKIVVGIDMGLNAFLTTSEGEKVENPRYLRHAERKLKESQREVSRCHKGSNNRRKAVKRLARQYERISAQRRDFAHQQSRLLVDRYDLIGFEKLNVKGLAAGRLAKSMIDAAWTMFLGMLSRKAENAGRHAVGVDPRGTSQTCPDCGAVQRKELSERIHACNCGLRIDRDEAAARVILSRALGVAGACGGLHLCAVHDGSVSAPDETESPKHAQTLLRCHDTA